MKDHITLPKICTIWQWAHAHGILWFYHVPQHSEAAGLVQVWNGLLKTQVMVPSRWKYLMGAGDMQSRKLYML